MDNTKTQEYQQIVSEYKELLTQKFVNTNKFIIDIKSAQAAYRKMQLESMGAQAVEFSDILRSARKDAVCYLLMELGEFLGDQQMVRASKSTRSFMQWGIKHIITKLNGLGIEMTALDMKELTVDICIERIEKLKDVRGEIAEKIGAAAYAPAARVI